ncbi:PREDICTED: uncharacterized protein LOC105619489 [Atta cephalotes]|uniref:Ribosome-binding factor A, mitochondrial n=1 Tax=Atta cephalotes TaxID=12957 RepID=A0A158NFT7_ATTCE|nr:PREDICTED: uncharacterized protein LOC105619489 [Atta cephalotes]
MESARSFFICFQISRCISSSSICSISNREGKFMKKLVNGSRKSKKKWYDSSIELRSVTNINSTNTSSSMHTRRRMIIRDKLFMQHITDMISMGQESDIIKESIEITHVKITQDFKRINVFYIPSNNNNAPVDQEALQKYAGIIRHELSQLRIIGVVPPIYFVENKLYCREKEIEKRLAMITFEEDSEILSKQMESDMPDVSGVDQILHKKSVVNDNSKRDEFYIQLPTMKHDVLGLDHHKIMSRITSVVSKAKKAAQIRMLDISTEKSDPVSNEIEFLTQEEQRKIFSDFLIKKQREARRMKQSNGRKLFNFEEEINNEESNYENDVNVDEYIDDIDVNEYNDNNNFQDDTRK